MREAIEHRRRGQPAARRRSGPCRPALMKAMIPIGPLVGKMMGQPPNLRELISSADGVTFWASYDKAEPRARLRAARPRGGPAPDARGRRPLPAPRRRLTRLRRDARHRRRAPRAAARDRLLGGRRGARRPRARVLAARRCSRRSATSSRGRVLLTHIHLDHAAATGALVRRWPELEVYVHERGAPHLIDPSKLLASAERLYGDQMERLWGEIVPVPEANVTAARAAARPCSGCGSPTPPATPPTTSATCTRRAAPPSSATSPPCRIPASTSSCPPRRRPTSTSRPGSSRSRPGRGLAPERLAAHPLRRDRGARRAPRASSASACARRPSWPATCPRTTTRRDLRAERVASAAEGLGRGPLAELLQAVPTAYQWRGLDRYWRKQSRARERPLAEVLAHPLDRLFDALVGGGQRDAEEALAARPVHRARRDDDRRLLEHQLGEGGRGVALGDRRPDVDRALRRR